MRITIGQIITAIVFTGLSYASDIRAQSVLDRSLSLSIEETPLHEALIRIGEEANVRFIYSKEFVEANHDVSLEARDRKLGDILKTLLEPLHISFEAVDELIVLQKSNPERSFPSGKVAPILQSRKLRQDFTVGGTVRDAETGESLPGVSVTLKGTDTGGATDMDGSYGFSIPASQRNGTLVVSFLGYLTQEVPLNDRRQVDIQLERDVARLDEVVVVGYGVQNKRDLTGSVVRADIEAFRESPNISILQSLQGSVPGLNIGQTNVAGEEPDIQIRGRTSLSGEQSPLIVLDGVIYRGNINDINPNDIESVDILKDASAAAIYGSQASNGVIILSSKKGVQTGKPVITLQSSYTLQQPAKEFLTGTPEDYLLKTELSDIYNSRTAESGYLAPDPNYDPSTKFKTNDEINAYNQGRSVNWYDLLTNDRPYIQNHNLSLSNATEWSNYYVSLGYTDQKGELTNEGYNRINARVNLDTRATDWLNFGIQSSFAKSDYLGQTPSAGWRYLSPFATPTDENGALIQITGGNTINPLLQMEADYVDERLSFFGNFYTEIDVPFVKGLSYKGNFLNNYETNSDYYFREYGSNFQGEGSKAETQNYNWSSDHILTYKRDFNNLHNIFLTLVYGAESIKSELTQAQSSIFANPVLGYHNLQSGSADQQRTTSGAWKETSLYQMARVYYGFNYKYLFTGTIRRDGFSGFGEVNKFGLFPSFSFAWVASEESFISDHFHWLNNLKLRFSYGSNGNRTIGRYQTLANISGGFNYITADGTPVYTQSINKLASPNLKWETTTGTNVGLDFSILSNKISGTIDYYNNETTDLLYQVDIPGIGRFEKFPDNLGRIHNQGLEISLNTVNIQKKDLHWETSFVFSRNRNELRELLGFDVDGDGKEDDLVSEGLFIGQPLDAIFGYRINGIWQLTDDIPAYSDLGAYKVVDLNGNGQIDPDDRTILGYREPSYRFGINSALTYRDFTLRFFINSVQGGKNRYLAEDDINGWSIRNQENHFNYDFPTGLDYWTPENTGARYERPNINISAGLAGTRFTQRSFVRLQDISLSYNLPAELLHRLQVRSLKVFISGKNLVTWTRWPGWDPETGENLSRSGRPIMKSYSLGLNLSF